MVCSSPEPTRIQHAIHKIHTDACERVATAASAVQHTAATALVMTAQQLARLAWLHDRTLSSRSALQNTPLPDTVANLVGRRGEFMLSMQRTVLQLIQLDESLGSWSVDDVLLEQHTGTSGTPVVRHESTQQQQRHAWLSEAHIHTAAMMRLAEGVLQFEASRDGAFWAEGRIIPRSHFDPHRAAFKASSAVCVNAEERASTVAPPSVQPPEPEALRGGLEAIAVALQRAETSLPAMYDALDIIGELKEVLQGTEVGELQQPLTMINAALTDTVGLLAAALVGHAAAAADMQALRRSMSSKGRGRGLVNAWQPVCERMRAQLLNVVRCMTAPVSSQTRFPFTCILTSNYLHTATHTA